VARKGENAFRSGTAVMDAERYRSAIERFAETVIAECG
jgi:hypothetical protein